MSAFLPNYISTMEKSSKGKWYKQLDEDDKVVPHQLSTHDNIQMCRTIDKLDESSEKSFHLVDKLHDDMAKLEKTTTYFVEMMKDEEGDGDDDIWMNNEDQSAFAPLIQSNCFHVDIQEQGHHERNGVHEQDKQFMKNQRVALNEKT